MVTSCQSGQFNFNVSKLLDLARISWVEVNLRLLIKTYKLVECLNVHPRQAFDADLGSSHMFYILQARGVTSYHVA